MLVFNLFVLIVGTFNILLFLYIQIDKIIRIQKKKEYLRKKREKYHR